MMRIKSDQLAAKSSHDSGEDCADFAGTDYSYSSVNKIKAHETTEFEIAVAGTNGRPNDLAVDRKQQTDSKLRYRIRRIVGDAYDLDTNRLGRFHVDMVEAGRTSRHKS